MRFLGIQRRILFYFLLRFEQEATSEARQPELCAAEQGAVQNVFLEFNGHAYQIITTPKSWSEAEEYAISIGGRLLVINSFQENVFIMKIIKCVILDIFSNRSH